MQNKQKVLIVDDNPNNIRLAADTLKALHISIVFATSGYKALEIIETQNIDLILMDINMPQLNGLEATMRIRHINPQIPVLFMSGYPREEVMKRFEQQPHTEFIRKPFVSDELAQSIRSVMETYSN